MPAKILLVAASLFLAMLMAGCGSKGCPNSLSGSSGGSANAGGAGSSANSAGCNVIGPGPTNSTQSALVYFMDDSAGQIAGEGLNIDGQGTFAPLASFVPPQMPTNVDDGGLVVVGEKYLYVPLSNASTGSVYGFSIDSSTGALSPLNNNPYAVSGLQGQIGVPFSIAADPNGKFVFVGDAAGITALAVNSTDGSLTTINSTPLATGIGAPRQMATDGLGKYLYVVDGTSIAELAYNSSGTLTLLGTLTSSLTGMAMMTGEPSGKWMLGVRAQVGQQGGALDYNVYVFSISSSGVLASAIPTSNLFPPTYLAVSPNGQFVYTFNEDDTSTTGTFLQPIVGLTFSSTTGALTNPVPFNDVLSKIGHIDQNGLLIFAAGQSSGATAAGTIPISIAKDGTLSSSAAHAGLPSYSFVVTDIP